MNESLRRLKYCFLPYFQGHYSLTSRKRKPVKRQSKVVLQVQKESKKISERINVLANYLSEKMDSQEKNTKRGFEKLKPKILPELILISISIVLSAQFLFWGNAWASYQYIDHLSAEENFNKTNFNNYISNNCGKNCPSELRNLNIDDGPLQEITFDCNGPEYEIVVFFDGNNGFPRKKYCKDLGITEKTPRMSDVLRSVHYLAYIDVYSYKFMKHLGIREKEARDAYDGLDANKSEAQKIMYKTESDLARKETFEGDTKTKEFAERQRQNINLKVSEENKWQASEELRDYALLGAVILIALFLVLKLEEAGKLS